MMFDYAFNDKHKTKWEICLVVCFTAIKSNKTVPGSDKKGFSWADADMKSPTDFCQNAMKYFS